MIILCCCYGEMLVQMLMMILCIPGVWYNLYLKLDELQIPSHGTQAGRIFFGCVTLYTNVGIKLLIGSSW